MLTKLLNEMENKTQTTLQILLQRLNSVKPNELCSIETIKGWAAELLVTEKEQIENAFLDGFETDIFEIDKTAEQYYSQTFQSNPSHH